MGRRNERINSIIKRIVAETLLGEIKDPRVGFVTVTSAEISEDYHDVTVYVSIMDEDKQKVTLQALNHMGGFFQRKIGPSLKMRYTPRVHFSVDENQRKAAEMDQLINLARSTDPGITDEKDEENGEEKGDTENGQ